MINSRVISSAWGKVSSIAQAKGENNLTTIYIAGLAVSVSLTDTGLSVVKSKYSKGKKIFVLFDKVLLNPDVGYVLAVYSITNRHMVDALNNWIKEGSITDSKILSYRPCYSSLD